VYQNTSFGREFQQFDSAARLRYIENHMKERHFHIAIFSTVFAVLLWLFVALTSEYQTTITLPLIIENLKPSRSLVKPLPATITAKVRGTGWQLLRLHSLPDSRYALDLSDISSRKRFITREDYQERLHIPVSVQVLEVRPETLTVVLEDRIFRKVPIVLKTDLSFREGYGIVGNVRISPDSAVLSGPESILGNIAEWSTKTLQYSNLKSGIETRIDLSDTLAFSVAVHPKNVTVQFEVQPTAEKSFQDVAIEVSHVPEDRTVVLIPPTIAFVIRGGVNQIAAVEMKDFRPYIDFKTILLDTTGKIKPSISGPRDIRIVKQTPEFIQYVVRK
jgi:YbbR domain-containing protein